jgi:hypothetical protein
MVGGLCMHKRTGDVTVRDNPRDCDSSKDPWETGCASGMCIGNVCSALCDRSSVCGSGDFCQYNPFKKDANSALNKTDFPQDYLGNYYYIVRSGLCLGRAGSLSDCMAAGTTGCSAGEYCYPGRDVTLDGGYSWNCVAGPGADGGTVKQVGESCASHSACRAGSCAFKNYCSSPCSLTRAGDCSFDGGTNMGCFAMPASNNPAQLVLLENDAGVSYPLANYSNNVCMKKGPGAPCFVQASPNCLGGPCIADGGSEGLCGPADGGI